MRWRRACVRGAVSAMVLGSLGCSAANKLSFTSLPSSDDIAAHSMQFCTDTVTYLEQHLTAIAPSVCATGQGLPDVSVCEGLFNACVASSNGVDASAVASDLGVLLLGCNNKLSGCQGVSVGQVAQCITDVVAAELAASGSITAQTACGGGGAPAVLTDPPSCTSLPTDCRIGL